LGDCFQPPLFGSILLSGQQTTQFTQDHLENGLITYKHMGPEASNNQVIEDSFKVKVTDGTHNRFYVYPNLNTPVRRPQKVSCNRHVDTVSMCYSVAKCIQYSACINLYTAAILGFVPSSAQTEYICNSRN